MRLSVCVSKCVAHPILPSCFLLELKVSVFLSQSSSDPFSLHGEVTSYLVTVLYVHALFLFRGSVFFIDLGEKNESV